MDKDLKAATRRDRKAREDDGKNEEMVRRMVQGKGLGKAESEFQEEMLDWIDKIREGYGSSAIRRTVRSVDNTGARISGLPPFEEHPLVIDLYQNEMENLDAIAEELVTDSSIRKATKFAAGKVRPSPLGTTWPSRTAPATLNIKQLTTFPAQNFYLKLRRALLHPSCNPDVSWHNPGTVAEWELCASRKLDTLALLLKHHLAEDGRTPMAVEDDKVVVGPPRDVPQPGDLPCDKIVVFCAFPSSNVQLTTVSSLLSLRLCHA